MTTPDQSREAFEKWDKVTFRHTKEAAFAAGWQARGAAEREAVAKWMIEHSFATGHGDTLQDLLKELSWQVQELRERVLALGQAEVYKNAKEKT